MISGKQKLYFLLELLDYIAMIRKARKKVIYFNNCEKYNPENSKFYKKCCSEIIKVSTENKTGNHIRAEVSSSKTENKRI